MAIPERSFQNPRFIRYTEGATLARDNNRRFDAMNLQYASRTSRAWRGGAQSPGYNAQNPSTRVERVNLSTYAQYIRKR